MMQVVEKLKKRYQRNIKSIKLLLSISTGEKYGKENTFRKDTLG